ncbi:hypothetical protein [Virgibacillus litoralis]|uniref:Glycogen biosynthesis protein GlgD n=1 Tax=Virgibacillus litoralis TaxID=578221 RepID=A0ABS4HG74_9BACI|nr:hypothetical protein [Virgibacillus litoralis]MBP1949929.1 hypothetical protein [Virgibacillus litoralis]
MAKGKSKKDFADENKLYNPEAKYYENQGSANTSNKVAGNQQMNRKNK